MRCRHAPAGRQPHTARRGAMLIDITMGLIVFIVALGAFLSLARENGDRIEDAVRHTRARDITSSVLASVQQLPVDELLEMASSRSERDFPGGKGVLEVGVEETSLDGVLALQVSFRYRATDGHDRQVDALGLHTRHGLRQGDDR